MIPPDIDEAAAAMACTPALRRLRKRIEAGGAAGRRDDLRLFLMAWAAGFVFFLIVIA